MQKAAALPVSPKCPCDAKSPHTYAQANLIAIRFTFSKIPGAMLYYTQVNNRTI
jgi:hypothetical protein